MTEVQFKQLLEQNNAKLIERIDARLEQNNDRLLKRVDKRLEKNNNHLLERVDRRLDERLEQNNAALFGQLSQYFDKRFETLDNKLDAGLDRIYTTFDGITKRLDDDDKERAAINVEQERQNGWISQLAKATNTKLVPEQ